MKSTADLFGDIRQRMVQGESVQDFILKQKPKQALNLEDIINESIIEASQANASQAKVAGIEELNDAHDSQYQEKKLGMLFEKSLSLDDMGADEDNHVNRHSSRLLDDIFPNRESRFNASDLARLVDQS